MRGITSCLRIFVIFLHSRGQHLCKACPSEILRVLKQACHPGGMLLIPRSRHSPIICPSHPRPRPKKLMEKGFIILGGQGESSGRETVLFSTCLWPFLTHFPLSCKVCSSWSLGWKMPHCLSCLETSSLLPRIEMLKYCTAGASEPLKC